MSIEYKKMLEKALQRLYVRQFCQYLGPYNFATAFTVPELTNATSFSVPYLQTGLALCRSDFKGSPPVLTFV